MARYLEASCKLCRREGEKLFLKGTRCSSSKCAIETRPYAPGMHGQKRTRKPSDYGVHLRAKQKLRRTYGVMEKQFRRTFVEADRRRGVTGENLLQLLEIRLDNVVFQLGLATSRSQARQLVSHGHFKVNDRKVNIPSFLVKVNDKITVREKSQKMAVFSDALEIAESRPALEWLSCNADTMTGLIERMPKREDISSPVDEQLVVEFYSK